MANILTLAAMPKLTQKDHPFVCRLGEELTHEGSLIYETASVLPYSSISPALLWPYADLTSGHTPALRRPYSGFNPGLRGHYSGLTPA